MCKTSSTEEKIKEAAKRVFLGKGFSGCTSREIAKEAGMNVALVNYYFRSKNQLFFDSELTSRVSGQEWSKDFYDKDLFLEGCLLSSNIFALTYSFAE